MPNFFISFAIQQVFDLLKLKVNNAVKKPKVDQAQVSRELNNLRKLWNLIISNKINNFFSFQINQPPGSAFSRYGPVQRTSITNVLVSKPKRTPPSLSEFLEIEENDLNGPYDGQRPFVTGHNRWRFYRMKFRFRNVFFYVNCCSIRNVCSLFYRKSAWEHYINF